MSILEEWDKDGVELFVPATRNGDTAELFYWTPDGEGVPSAPDDTIQISKATEEFAARLVASALALILLTDKTSKDEEGLEDSKRLRDEAGTLWSLKNGLDGSMIGYWNGIAKYTLTAWDAHDADFIRKLSALSTPDPQRCATAIQWFAGAYIDFQARSQES
ncbi:hypothetical protein IAT38_003393 [Cryptococcus sp. DSM 104549]